MMQLFTLTASRNTNPQNSRHLSKEFSIIGVDPVPFALVCKLGFLPAQ